MNLQALYAYGAGLTAGLIYPQARRWRADRWEVFSCCVYASALWPIVAIGALCVYLRAHLKWKP